MKKSEILTSLAKGLSVRKLMGDFPSLGPDALSSLLNEAAKALGEGRITKAESAPKAHSTKCRRLVLHTDGASRGNPGESGVGVLIEDDTGHIVKKHARYLGTATNNQAEYTALIDGLKAAHALGADEVAAYADSELIVKQMRGEYRVKDPSLQVMHTEACKLVKNFSRFVIEYIPRAKNSEADALANEAIDKRMI